MKKILLTEQKNFYKANLHCHTTLSDGKLTPNEIKDMYKAHGYSAVAFTDHDIMLPHHELTDDEFVALTGFETEINETGSKPTDDFPFRFQKCCHICMIALDPDNDIQPLFNIDDYFVGNSGLYKHLVKYDSKNPPYVREYSRISEYMQQGRNRGFFVTYNHPAWSMQDYSDYMSYHGMHAMEISNYGCIINGYLDYNPRVYDDILRGGEKIFAVSADDTHGTNHAFGGYVMINADTLSYKSLTDALVAGNFYAVNGDGGATISKLWVDNRKIGISCSGAVKISVTTDIRRAYSVSGDNVKEAEFDIHPDAKYFRIEITDSKGRYTNTNAYFF